jgi:hypothetical protein
MPVIFLFFTGAGHRAAHKQTARTTEFALALARAAGSGTGSFPAHHGRTSVMARRIHVVETPQRRGMLQICPPQQALPSVPQRQ